MSDFANLDAYSAILSELDAEVTCAVDAMLEELWPAEAQARYTAMLAEMAASYEVPTLD